MKYFISGANGQLGKEIQDSAQQYKNSEFNFFGRELDICNKVLLQDHFEENEDYDYFINCAAYTNVEKAEEDQITAFEVNFRSLQNIIALSNKYNFTLIHISTDFVFDGSKKTSYNEIDSPNPISVYGKSKLQGEKFIIENCKNYIIIRTSWLYSKYGNNFVKKIIDISRKNKTISVVSDEIGSPTNASDLASDILFISEQKLQNMSKTKSELYHYANKGFVSRYDFAKEIIKLSEINCEVKPVSSDHFCFKAKRPKNSILDPTKMIKEFGLNIKSWELSLKECLKSISSYEK